MLRRVITIIAAAVLLFSCLPVQADTMQKGSMYVYTPNGRSLHFRTTRSTGENNIICEIPYGTKVYVVSWDGTWARIQYSGTTGYVVKRFLHLGQPAPYEVVQAENEKKDAAKEERKALSAAQKKLDKSTIKKVAEYDATVRVDVEGGVTNLYSKSNLLSDILKICPSGTRFTVLGQNSDWAKVYDGASDKTGYVLLADLEADEVDDELILD